MRKSSGRKPDKRSGGHKTEVGTVGPRERALTFLERLQSGGPNPVNAAEELDRLQPSLARMDAGDWLRDQVLELAEAWRETDLRGDRLEAWLALIGAFDLTEFGGDAAAKAESPALPPQLRIRACFVARRLLGTEAAEPLARVLGSMTDARVRQAAAEALGDLADPSLRPLFEALLDEELPRDLWNAVSAAAERLPTT
jgi:HEAT repeat protein